MLNNKTFHLWVEFVDFTTLSECEIFAIIMSDYEIFQRGFDCTIRILQCLGVIVKSSKGKMDSL